MERGSRRKRESEREPKEREIERERKRTEIRRTKQLHVPVQMCKTKDLLLNLPR